MPLGCVYPLQTSRSGGYDASGATNLVGIVSSIPKYLIALPRSYLLFDLQLLLKAYYQGIITMKDLLQERFRIVPESPQVLKERRHQLYSHLMPREWR